MKITPEKIYRDVFSYCLESGLVARLKHGFKMSKNHGFNELNISKNGLSLADAVHCLYDKKRTFYFLREIEKHVTSDTVVVEAGIGTGILSFFASTKAKTVYGFEINQSIFRLAQKIKIYLVSKNIFAITPPIFLLKDAIKAKLPQKVDLIISENIYTGMFFEKQVQITNNLLKYLKNGGKVVPEILNSFIILGETIFPHTPNNKELFVPSIERGITFKSKSLSKSTIYDSLFFLKKMPLSINKELLIPIIKDGVLNSMSIYSDVIMPSGLIIGRKDTLFLNGDIIIAIAPSVQVKRGDSIKLRFAYKYGDNPQTATIKLNLIHK